MKIVRTNYLIGNFFSKFVDDLITLWFQFESNDFSFGEFSISFSFEFSVKIAIGFFFGSFTDNHMILFPGTCQAKGIDVQS